MGRKIFDRQFKIAAVKLVLDDKIPVAQELREELALLKKFQAFLKKKNV